MRLLPVVAIPGAKVTFSGYLKVKDEAIEAAKSAGRPGISLLRPYGDFCGKGFKR
jgi:hypothetical protein